MLPLSSTYMQVTAPNGKKWLSRWAAMSYPFVSVAAKKISINKTLGYEFAAHYGVSIPRTIYLPGDNDKMADFLTANAPIIAKPADGSGSHGLTLGIKNTEDLHKAIDYAHEYSGKVILQRQFIGQEVRITIADGEVVSVIWRQPPRVIGNGHSTIAQLIEQENDARRGLQFEQIPYPPLSSAIIPADFMTSNSIPGAGEVVELSKNSLTSGGASLYDISDEIHESYLKTAVKLARELNPAFLVVDLMIENFEAPQTDDNYVFMEFNTAPALRLYFGMRGGKIVDMPAKIVDMLDVWSRHK
ncbi:MAG TPA: hypothetical protein VF575_04240 [Candidatus Saccharimonadales bacterium]